MESNYLVPIGKRIAKIRKAHGMTQETLADKLSVTPKHISHTERGTSNFSISNLIEFCNLFGCSLDYLILGKENNVLSKLPNEIVEILYHGNDDEINKLSKYLNVYLELTKSQLLYTAITPKAGVAEI